MQLSNIKKEREDLEKLVNNFRSIIYKTITVLLLASGMIYSQDVYRKGGTYVIDTITVVGLENFSDRTVVTYSGLREGQSIQMPGEEISTILKKLWNLELFSNVDLYITDIKDGAIKLEISVEELPTLLNFKVNGVKKSKAETYIEETELSEGKRLSESFLTNTKNYIRDELKKDGFSRKELEDIKNFCLQEDSFLNLVSGLMVDTGCSYNEIVGLKVDDINFDNKYINRRINVTFLYS